MPITNQSTIPKLSASPARPSPPTASTHNVGPNSQASNTVPADVLEFVRRTREDPTYEWKQPINFYGKVVDENDRPLDGATVFFSWTDLSVDGTSEKQLLSGPDGLFSLVNQTGKRLSARVIKDGYYTPKSEFLSFEYANPADGLFAPNPSNPVIFHLRKKGVGAELITSRVGMKPYLGVTMPLDGTPVSVDLLGKKQGQGGQLVLSQKKPTYETWKHATEWSFRMEIPDGGFLEHNEEFHFMAPEVGYQSAVELQFQKNGTNWAEDVRKDYYVKFGNPPRYGRLHVDTSILTSGARLTYAFNPSGSRNLESK